MTKSGKAHIVGCLVGAGLSILTLAKGWPIPAGIVVVAVDLYLVLALVIAALRRDGAKSRLAKIDFPTHAWSLLFFACLAICTVCGFASLYVGSKGVIHSSQDLADIEAHTLVNRKPTDTPVQQAIQDHRRQRLVPGEDPRPVLHALVRRDRRAPPAVHPPTIPRATARSRGGTRPSRANVSGSRRP